MMKKTGLGELPWGRDTYSSKLNIYSIFFPLEYKHMGARANICVTLTGFQALYN